MAFTKKEVSNLESGLSLLADDIEDGKSKYNFVYIRMYPDVKDDEIRLVGAGNILSVSEALCEFADENDDVAKSLCDYIFFNRLLKLIEKEDSDSLENMIKKTFKINNKKWWKIWKK